MGHPPRIPVWLPLEQEVVYFLTICIDGRQRVLANDNALQALEHAVARLTDWHVYAAILMPDHLHALAAPTRARDAAVGNLAGALKRWIRQEMRMAGEAPALQVGIVGQPPRLASLDWHWQAGSFDRLLRSDESAQAKWEYMRENPVRAGLVKEWDEWPYSNGFRRPPEP